MQTFSLAPMSAVIRLLTLFLLALPLFFALSLALGRAPMMLAVAAVGLLVLYAVVWLAFRPSYFEVGRGALSIVFPLRRLETRLTDVADCRIISADDFRSEFGWAARVGVGGLWGGFGRLWTSRRGWIQFYITRIDRFLLVERRSAVPLLLTPSDCEGMAMALRAAGSGAVPPTGHIAGAAST